MTETPTTKARSWRRWVCAGSLLLNFVVIGVVLGAVIHHALDDDRHARRPPMAEFALLSHDGRRALWPEREEIREAWRDKRRDFREARNAVARALRAEPFDRAAAEEALTALNAIEAAGRETLQDRLLTLAEEASPADRADYFREPKERDRRD